MSTKRWTRGLVAFTLGIVATPILAGQGPAPARPQSDLAAGFKEFSDRVQEYLKLQKTVESSLPTLTSTDLPEAIVAHQQVLARKIREARPAAKAGDLFTPAACEAFRRASQAALEGPDKARSLWYMQPGAPDPLMRLVVNQTYPDTEPITSLSPQLLAAFPALSAEVAYRVVDRALILVDVRSGLIIDVARLILPASLSNHRAQLR